MYNSSSPVPSGSEAECNINETQPHILTVLVMGCCYIEVCNLCILEVRPSFNLCSYTVDNQCISIKALIVTGRYPCKKMSSFCSGIPPCQLEVFTFCITELHHSYLINTNTVLIQYVTIINLIYEGDFVGINSTQSHLTMAFSRVNL